MNTLIIYGTNSGGTLEAAELIRDTLASSGHTVAIKNANGAEPADLTGHQLVVFGSCTWELVGDKERLEGQLQQDWLSFRDRLGVTTTPNQKYAVFGLGDSSFAHFCAAADHLEEIVKKLGGTLVQPSLRIDGFYFQPDNRQIVIDWAKKLAVL